MNLGQAIRAARLERDLSQSALAEKTGISNSYLSQIEAGKQDPSLETLQQLSAALDVPPYVLLLKAIHETDVRDPDQRRFVREIKHHLENVVDELYAVKS